MEEDGLLAGLVKARLSRDHTPQPLLLAVMGIASPPPTATILDQLGAMKDLDDWGRAKEISTACIARLSDCLEDLQAEEKERLKKTRLLACNNTLVTPQHVFWDCDVQLSPFAHRVPLEVREHEDLLRQIGVKDRPTVEALALALEQVHIATREQGLSPNQLSGAAYAVKTMIQLSRHSTHQQRNLRIPTHASRLAPKSRVVFVDRQDLLSRVDLTPAALLPASHLLSATVCRALGVPFLSEVCQTTQVGTGAVATPAITAAGTTDTTDTGTTAADTTDTERDGTVLQFTRERADVVRDFVHRHYRAELPPSVQRVLSGLSALVIKTVDRIEYEVKLTLKDSQHDVTRHEHSPTFLFDHQHNSVWVLRSATAIASAVDLAALCISRVCVCDLFRVGWETAWQRSFPSLCVCVCACVRACARVRSCNSVHSCVCLLGAGTRT